MDLYTTIFKKFFISRAVRKMAEYKGQTGPDFSIDPNIKPFSIYSQTYKNYEVCIIDNSDNQDIITKGAFLKQIELFHNTGINAYVIKNEVSQNAPDTHQKILEISKRSNINYVFKIDDDCILNNDVVEKLMSSITSDEKIGAVTCSILEPNKRLQDFIIAPDYPRQTMETLGSGINRQWFWDNELLEQEVEHIYSSFIYRTKAVEDVGGFPKDLSKVAFREETLTTYPMFLKGWKLVLNANAVIWHMKASYGGCRDNYIEELYNSDDEKFRQRLKEMKEDNNA